MFLKEWDWDLESFVEREYPDEIIKGFVDFIRLNNQWPDNPIMVRDRKSHLERELTEHRNEMARQKDVQERCTAVTAAGGPCKVKVDIVDGLCHIHRRSLVTA